MPPEACVAAGRITREIANLLVGATWKGKVFSEQTKTVLLAAMAQALFHNMQFRRARTNPSQADTDKEA